jgi:small subunit ribosomal protein S20
MTITPLSITSAGLGRNERPVLSGKPIAATNQSCKGTSRDSIPRLQERQQSVYQRNANLSTDSDRQRGAKPNPLPPHPPRYRPRLTFVLGWAIMPAHFRRNEGSCTTLANTQSAIKRIRSSERRRKINQVHRSRARTYVKRARRLIASGQIEEAETVTHQAVRALDKAAQKGIIHKNNAARRKARLVKRLNQAKQQAA